MKLTTRPVTIEDAELLLKWKNEEDTRKNSIVTTAVILMEDHMRWLTERLARPLEDDRIACDFWVVLLDGEPCGDVRLEGQEISIRMDKKYRGLGLATQVIAMFSGPLIAKIRTHNIASMRVFLANGFRPVEHVECDAPYLIFRK